MQFEIRERTYNFLLSHTFPGLFLAIEILIAFELFTPLRIFSNIFILFGTVTNFISLIIITYAISTLFGFVLDGIHHFIFSKKEDGTYKACEFISSFEQMELYKHFLEDDLWYPYEAFANIAIAMIPGVFLLPYGLQYLKVNWLFTLIIMAIYLTVEFILFKEAIETLALIETVDRNFAENFKNKNKTT